MARLGLIIAAFASRLVQAVPPDPSALFLNRLRYWRSLAAFMFQLQQASFQILGPTRFRMAAG